MSVSQLFDGFPDPRAANACHRLGDILVIVLAASLCGQKTATDMALFAELRREALAPLVSYTRAPSHDTISRLLRLLDPAAFAALLQRFASAFAEAREEANTTAADRRSDPTHVAIDGKVMRRACEAAQRSTPPMMVSAFASEAGLTLAALSGPAEGGCDEGKLAIEVINLIDIAGKIITADAAHCNRAMADTLTKGRADYVLALKRNCADWYDEAKALFASTQCKSISQTTTGHGRVELRQAAVIIAPTPRVSGHKAYGRIVATRDGKAETTRYYLLSKTFDPAQFLTTVRRHWHIETALHWVLDVQFNEDQRRGRKDNSAANTAFLTRLARNLLQLADKPDVPISQRITKCTFSDTYLLKAISHMQ